MSTYTDLTYIEKDFTTANGIVLSYTTLMSDLRLMPSGKFYNTYLSNRNEDGSVDEDIIISDDQLIVNTAIEKIKSFNVTVYAIVKRRNEDAHKTIKYDIDDHNFDHVIINGHYMKQPENLDEDYYVDPTTTLTYLESIFFNNTDAVSVNIDDRFIQYDSKGLPIYDSEGNPIYGSIRKGDYFYLYLVVGTITNPEDVTDPVYKNKLSGENAELFYKFIYNPAEEAPEENKDDNEDADNEWVIVPGEDEDENMEITYPVKYTAQYLSDERWSDYIFLNTVSWTELGKLPNSTLQVYDRICRVFINPLCPVPFECGLYVTTNNKVKKYTFKYVPKTLNVTSPHLRRAVKMNNPDVSYALLRTNPKLTGNVKVVVDENSNIYVDTFKVSNSLSQRKYRHIKVGSNSYYGNTLVKYFKDMPTTDFYKVENKCYNLFSTVQSYQEQFYDMYRYGVKTNDDNLYSENYALLAPLCIKRVMPDFFLIFRVDKISSWYDEETMSNEDKIKYFLSQGKLIKSFDMRKNSSLGTYIRNIYDKSKDTPGDMFVSYSTDNLNKFIGISLEKGTVSSMYESVFNEANIKSQVALNEFYTEGFERNHIVSKNIINFEFMFNDNEVEPFSLNTYFGIYVKVNEQEENFSCLDNDTSTGYIFDTSIYSFDPGFKLSSSKLNAIIYGLTTPYEFIRLDEGLYYNPALIPYKSKPYKNLLTTKVNKINLKDAKSFITININKPFEVGEHYKIIDTFNDVIYEVIICSIESACELQQDTFDKFSGNKSKNHNLSDVITNYYNEFGVNFEIKRVGLYTYYRNENDATNIDEIIAEQAEQLYYAFQKLGDNNITSFKYDSNNVSFISRVDGTIFERICAPSGFDNTLNQYVYGTTDEDDSITYFGSLNGHKMVLDLSKTGAVMNDVPLWKTKAYSYLYPIHFEIAGNRIAYAFGFMNINEIGDGENIYECEIEKNSLDIFDTKTILYHNTDKHSKDDTEIHRSVYEEMNIDIFINDDKINSILTSKQKVKYLQSFSDLSKYIINIKNPLLKNKNISLYSSYPLNSGVCSIFNIKDFDFNVLDDRNIINSSKSNNFIGTSGEYRKNSIFTSDAKKRNEGDKEDEEELTIDDIKGVVSTNKTETNEFGNIYCYSLLLSTYEKDQILHYGDYNYVIKHYTIGGYLSVLKERLRALNNKLKFDVVVNAEHFISEDNLTKLKLTLGIEDSEDYDGIILRPFITSENVAYDEGYAYFDHIVRYSNKVLGNINEYLGVYSDTTDEDGNIAWGGLDELLNTMSIIDFNLENSVFEEYYENPEIVYEDKKDLRTICLSKPIAPDTTSEENFLDYVDKFEKYIDPNSLLEGEKRNIIRTTYLKNMYKDNHAYFDISLISPYVCKWKSIGTDARIENLRLMYDYTNLRGAQSYYLVNEKEFNGYLGVLYLQNKNSVIPQEFGKKYINRSLDDVLFTNKKSLGTYEKDFILEGDGAIDDILYDTVNSDNKFSVAYSLGDNSLEFISGGIKFKIKSNSIDILDFSKYSGYSAVFVSLPIKNISSNKQVELIIDEINQEILFVWYCYTNSLECGVKMRLSNTNDLDNNVDVMRGLNACKINYTKGIADITYKPIITDYGSYKGSLIEDTMGFSTMVDSNTKDSEYLENNIDRRFTRHGKKLCDRLGCIYISNMGTDPTSYTAKNIAIVTGQIYNEAPIIKNIDKTYPYYNEEGYLTPANPFIWHTNKDAQYNFHEELTDSGIDLYANNLGNIKDSLVYLDDITCAPSSIRTLQDLKDVINDCGIYIKKANGKYDYSTVENLLNISIVDPIKFSRYKTYKRNVIDTEKIIKDSDEQGHIVMHTDVGEHQLNILSDTDLYIKEGYVHSTYAEPVMKDMLSFHYNSYKQIEEYDVDDSTDTYITNNESLEKVFDISFDGANVFIKDTNDIEQIWINKYTTNNNYCLVGSVSDIKSMIFPIDVIKNVSIMGDCLLNTEFRKYSVVNDSELSPSSSKFPNYVYEDYVPIKGYTCGVEVKTFLNSQALSLNLDKIEIEKWKDTEITLSEKCIKLNITNSLIEYILSQSSFYDMWKNIKLKDNLYKIQYIKNCILKYININNKIKFELRRSKNKIKKLKCSNTYNKNFIEYKNFKNELKYENDKYYMYVYVDEFYTYYPKITIIL